MEANDKPAGQPPPDDTPGPSPIPPLPPRDAEGHSLQQPAGPPRPADSDAIGEGDVEELVQETDGSIVHERELSTQRDNIRAEADAPPARPPQASRRHGRRPPLSRGEIDAFRAVLLELKRRRRGTMDRLTEQAAQDGPEGMGETSSLPLHLGNVASEAFEQDRDLGLAEGERRDIEAIDRALERLDQGRYGVCESCNESIGRERLTAVPYATRCIDCQRAQDAA
jgi:RNA polymerase-binding protein DksA